MIRLLLFASLCILAAVDRPLADSIGVVKKVEGTVLVDRGGDTFSPAVGDEMFLDDNIRTMQESALGIILSDGTTVALGEGSECALVAFAFEPSRGLFDLMVRLFSGRLVYGSGRIGEARPDRVRIETPQLTVGTRGTRFAVIAPPAP